MEHRKYGRGVTKGSPLEGLTLIEDRDFPGDSRSEKEVKRVFQKAGK